MNYPNRFFPAVLTALVLLGGLPALAQDTAPKHVVVIDYGKARASRCVEVPFEKGRTALEVLQAVATVETHVVGPHVFVTAIDGVQGKRGQTAWYYRVNGKSPHELAYTKRMDAASKITWMYQKDVCSWRVDGKKPQSTKATAEKK